MKKASVLKIILAASLLFTLSQQGAEAVIAFDMADVGNVSNAADDHPASVRNGRGSVSYEYQIGIYEVTNAQYAEFLNAVAQADPYELYHASMGSSDHGGILQNGTEGHYTYEVKAGYENRPVVLVDLMDAMYFSNWLTNGQGEGSILTGSYDVSLSMPMAVARLAPSAPGQVQYFVASENEWYKAAYYDPTLNGGQGGYWDYATRSNTAPTPSVPGGGANIGNLNKKVNHSTDVGSYAGSYSYYGLFDLEGNVSEFTDTLRYDSKGIRWERRGVSNYGNNLTGASNSGADAYDTHASLIGFRIVAVKAIPEPSSFVLLTAAGVGLLLARRSFRKRNQVEPTL
ncbi:MAG TPA: SUMF1/EgtB/PvdO family nonheme iron enzyme [Chthoniobacteraceae bacterium]|nr:SUMF1/EgtB/PvdO family nonheme iron enzyme [Chthoniobacteraceae bacterium]